MHLSTWSKKQRSLVRTEHEENVTHDDDAALDPTIYALSTAPGRAAIAIIRISGVSCTRIYHALCPSTSLPRSRYAAYRTLYRPTVPISDDGSAKTSTHEVLDPGALILFFRGPATLTGADTLELHTHGGPAIVRAVLAAVGACSTPARPVRYAEPGEFTRRAFLAGRLSLPQVEALGDALAAATEQQRRVAVRGGAGGAAAAGLARVYEGWRAALLLARGELEALIDFAEDQHFDESAGALARGVAVRVRALRRNMARWRDNAVRGQLLRAGISLALLGAPNAGKSSLLNSVVGREAAIVSRVAGTTRDVVEVGVDLAGFYCRVADAAGLRGASVPGAGAGADALVGEVESEGIRRAKQRAWDADLVVAVFAVQRAAAGTAAVSDDHDGVHPPLQLHLDGEVLDAVRQLRHAGKPVVAVINKLDLCTAPADAVAAGLHPEEARLRASLIRALPCLEAANIFCISCRDAAAGDAGVDADTDADLGGTAGIVAAPDPGNLQTLLAGLTRTFKAMTAAVAGDALEGAGEAAAAVWEDSLGATERQRVLLDSCMRHLALFLDAVDTVNAVPAAMVGPSDRIALRRDAALEAEAEPEGLEEPQQLNDDDVDIVVAAEHLRAAADDLARITGRGDAGDVEEVLGVVFEK